MDLMIGVDPGLAGGIAILEDDSDEPVALVPMPVIEPPTRGGKRQGRTVYDVDEIVAILRRSVDTGPCRATIERLHPMPLKLGGAIANYNRGAAFWLFVGLFKMGGIPFHPVRAQMWQGAMLEGVPGADTKARSLAAAALRFPSACLLPTSRSRKPSDGLSDALLLAEFGRLHSA